MLSRSVVIRVFRFNSFSWIFLVLSLWLAEALSAAILALDAAEFFPGDQKFQDNVAPKLCWLGTRLVISPSDLEKARSKRGAKLDEASLDCVS